MVIGGDDDYQFTLSRLVYSFRGSLGMEYIQRQGFRRINELIEHASKLADELRHGE